MSVYSVEVIICKYSEMRGGNESSRGRDWHTFVLPTHSPSIQASFLNQGLSSFTFLYSAFAPYSTLPISTTSNAPAIQPSLWQQKTVFLLCQLLAVSLGVYKAWAMGLLPTASSDWLAWREARVVSLGLEAQENSA